MKIRPVNVTNFRTNKVKNLFEKYTISNVCNSVIGRVITVQGPKKTFTLYECMNPLTIIAPPAEDFAPAIQKKVPLFWVTTEERRVGKIQGCEYFAEINGELVPYTKAGGYGGIRPLGQ